MCQIFDLTPKETLKKCPKHDFGIHERKFICYDHYSIEKMNSENFSTTIEYGVCDFA